MTMLERLATPALDPLAEPVQKAIQAAFRRGGATGQAAMDFLHGTWLGHPLHAMLTDVPVGAWCIAALLDGLGSDAADTAIAAGLGTALLAAAAGATDWSETSGTARRLGLVHGLLNLGVAGLYGTSLALRQRGQRPAGRVVAWIGLGLLGVSAWMGGHLTYRLGVRVAPEEQPGAGMPGVGEEQPELLEVDQTELSISGTP